MESREILSSNNQYKSIHIKGMNPSLTPALAMEAFQDFVKFPWAVCGCCIIGNEFVVFCNRLIGVDHVE